MQGAKASNQSIHQISLGLNSQVNNEKTSSLHAPDNDLSPIWHQAIAFTNADKSLRDKFSKI